MIVYKEKIAAKIKMFSLSHDILSLNLSHGRLLCRIMLMITCFLRLSLNRRTMLNAYETCQMYFHILSQFI